MNKDIIDLLIIAAYITFLVIENIWYLGSNMKENK